MTKLNTQSAVPVKTRTDWQYCEKILPEVSRTFALNIGALKGDTHKATLLGYLFSVLPIHLKTTNSRMKLKR